jgi:hypothetical protein
VRVWQQNQNTSAFIAISPFCMQCVAAIMVVLEQCGANLTMTAVLRAQQQQAAATVAAHVMVGG